MGFLYLKSEDAPILFASAEDIWLIDIEEKQAKYCMSHYGIDVNTSVKQFQGKFDVPEEIGNEVEE